MKRMSMLSALGIFFITCGVFASDQPKNQTPNKQPSIYEQLFNAIKTKEFEKVINLLNKNPLIKVGLFRKLELMEQGLTGPQVWVGHNDQFNAILFYLDLYFKGKLNSQVPPSFKEQTKQPSTKGLKK